jgi:DNA-binding PucR family transcriptional regulator
LIEVFDDFTKVCAGDFIMTTAYAWEQYCGNGAEVVAALRERGAVCLAFQEDIYQPRLPESLVVAAAAQGFTLLVMPKHFTFRLVSQVWVEAGQLDAGARADIRTSCGASPGSLPQSAPEGLIPLLQEHALAWALASGLAEAQARLPEWETMEKTLQVWFAAHCNHTAAAAQLGVHRHTVRNRLAQFGRDSGLDLTDQLTRLLLELALLPPQEQKSAATKA